MKKELRKKKKKKELREVLIHPVLPWLIKGRAAVLTRTTAVAPPPSSGNRGHCNSRLWWGLRKEEWFFPA